MEWFVHREAAMKRGLQKIILAAALALWGIAVTDSVPAGGRVQQKAETQAVQVLTKLGIPLQQDSHGAVRWIEATDGQFKDEAMRYLPDLPGLEWLEIGGGSVSPAGVALLKGCSDLRRLYIHDINLNGDDLAWLAGLTKLEALSLQRTGVSGKILKNFKSLTTLAVLNLSGNNITSDDMGQIAGLKRLEVLALANTAISGAGIAKLEGMTSLNELNIMHCKILDGDIESFLSMPNLRIVYAEGCNLSDMAVQNVIARFPMLAIFR
jgi:hypothetical protein